METESDQNMPEVTLELDASEDELLEEFGVLVAAEYNYKGL